MKKILFICVLIAVVGLLAYYTLIGLAWTLVGQPVGIVQVENDLTPLPLPDGLAVNLPDVGYRYLNTPVIIKATTDVPDAKETGLRPAGCWQYNEQNAWWIRETCEVKK